MHGCATSSLFSTCSLGKCFCLVVLRSREKRSKMGEREGKKSRRGSEEELIEKIVRKRGMWVGKEVCTW